MEERPMEIGNPMQIIDFEKVDNDVNGKKKMVLKKENLERIFKGVQDMPIALISITGASRQGKSFLLSFMIRYLEALKKDELDWMGWGNSKEALIGFKWRDGISPETSGMWLWSEPFIVESNGEKLAIILMDTQGTFDEFTTQREWSTIVGLSMLMSSCMIFNCQGSVQEDVLNTLETYVQYGMQALQQIDTEGPRPFQKLMFLIRDWAMVSQYPYGPKGGSQFIQKKLSFKKGQSEQARRIRESLQNCFESTECFLMPDPGEKAKENDFNGAISQLSSNFAKKIEAFVTDLLNPDDILKKTVFGQDMSGQDAVNYFEKYVEIFNGDELPEPLSIYQATAQLSNQSLIQKATKIYMENMKKKFRGNNFVSEKKFMAAHKDSEKKAADYFKKGKKLGNEETVSMCEDDFQEQVKHEFKNLHTQNKNKREKEIAKAEEKAISSYKEKMEDDIGEDFMDDKKLIGISETQISELVSEFEVSIEDDDEKETEKLVATLKEKLESEQKILVSQNKLKRTEAEQFMNNLLENVIECHCGKLNEKFDDNETMTDDDLKDIQEIAGKESAKRFGDSEKKGDRSFIATYKKLLEECLEKKGVELIALYLRDQEGKRMRTQKLIGELVDDFKTKLTLDIEKVEDEDALQERQNKYVKEAMEAYEENHAFLSANEVVTKLGEDLKKKLTNAFKEDILEKYHLKLKESEASFENAVTEALTAYNDAMYVFIGSSEFHTEDNLKSCHEKEIKSAIDVYNKYPKSGKYVDERNEKMLVKLELEIEEAFEKTKERNELKKSNLEQKSLNYVTECMNDYEVEMKNKLEMARDEGKLKKFHLEALTRAEESFRKKCAIKTDEKFLETYIANIKEQGEEYFEEILELYRMTSEKDSVATEKAVIDAKRFYHEEMEKHYSNTKFMRPKELEKLHTDVSKRCIDRCRSAAPLTAIQKEDLEASLKITYKQYEETNNMNVPVNAAIGIDLGTTYSCVAVYHRGNVEVIANKQGKKTTPSYVAFKNGLAIIGDAAKNQAHENPENTIFDAKRMIGRRMDDEKLKNDIKLWPFKVVEENGTPKVEAEGQTYFPEQISAKILQEMKENAESFLGYPVKKAVITVPAYFSDGQRQATIDAGTLAGLEVLKIIDEPTAAAIAYKLQHMDNESRNVLIFDLGGGTFDVAVLEMRKGVIEVKAKDGDTHLGGEDFDNNLVDHCALEFQSVVGVDILDGKDSTDLATRRKCLKAMRRVRNECERRKIDLATSITVNVAVDSVESSYDMKVPITRSEFENMNQEHFENTIKIVERVLESAGKSKSEIDDIVLVGGSTRIPKIQELLKNYFGGKALNQSVNPDEAVAVGAAIQAAIVNGEIAKESKDFNNILDITPFDIGVEVYGGQFDIIIPKNSRIPCKVEDTYRTAHNNQTSVQIVVYHDNVVHNNKVGEFYLNGIPPADAEREVVKVIMSINEQGVLEVTAACSSNGISKTGLVVNEQKWRIGRDVINRILAEGRVT